MRRLLVALTVTAFLAVPAVALADVVTGTDAGETSSERSATTASSGSPGPTR
jgi:hypothetical protein